MLHAVGVVCIIVCIITAALVLIVQILPRMLKVWRVQMWPSSLSLFSLVGGLVGGLVSRG
jgi:hypothetical protein